MGYTTDFTGTVTVTPPLNQDEVTYLRRFADTRRMNRRNGPYYTGSGHWGQEHERDIIDYNAPPREQPNLWCQWTPTDDGTAIGWDGGEKFYDAASWMRYLIDTFLKPDATLASELGARVNGRYYAPEFNRFTFDHVVSGIIRAQGEDGDDRWELVVVDNTVLRRELPTLADRMSTDPALRAAFETVRTAGITVEQFARLTGQEY